MADIPDIRLYTADAAAELINGSKDARGERRIVSARWLSEQAGKGAIPHTVMSGKRCWTISQLRAAVAAFERPAIRGEESGEGKSALPEGVASMLTPRSRAHHARGTR